MMYKVLEVNVDDIGYGGVFSLVKRVISRKKANECIDIAAIEEFENQRNIQELSEYGCNVHYIGYAGNKILKQLICFKNLKKLIRRENYECIHIHADVANKLLVSGLAARTAGAKKIVLHSHAAGVDGNHRKIKMFMHKVCRRALKYIGTDFVSCSGLAAKWMFPNISNSSIVIIKNGVDLEKFRHNKAVRTAVRNELGIKDEYIVGHVGRFAYQKNHAYLIDVFSKLCQTNDNVKLLLVGEGVLKDEIGNKVKSLGLEEKVIFYGITHTVEKLFCAMDIFVLPSNFEGLPIVGVEAQASGLPVIFSDAITSEAGIVQNVRFLPIDGQSICKWCDCINDYLKADRVDTYDVMKSAGFSIEDTIKSFYELYRKG